MGNLGLYEVMVTTAKRDGGPAKLSGLVLGIGAAHGAGANEVVHMVENRKLQKRHDIV